MHKLIKQKLLAVLLLLSVVLLAAGCGGTQTPLNNVDVEQYQETRALGENGQTTVELSYPVVSAVTNDSKMDAMLEKLNEQFRQDAEAFVQQAEALALEQENTGEAFVYSAEVRYNDKGMLSVVQAENFAGQRYLQYAATYSLADGEKMTLGQLMDMKESEAEETVEKQLCGVVQAYPDTFHADAQEYIQQHFSEVQYYRCAEGMGVFFQAGDIAPAELGVQEIVMQ